MTDAPKKKKRWMDLRFSNAARAQSVSRWEFSSGSKYECNCLICREPIARHLPRFWAQGYGARHEQCEVK